MIGINTRPSIYDHWRERGYDAIPLCQAIEVDEETYDYFLGVMPPIYQPDDYTGPVKKGMFCVCEPVSHIEAGPIYNRFYIRGGKYCHDVACIPDKKTVCPNCQQWQSGPRVDCFNECRKRGFVDAPVPKGWESTA